MTNSRARRVAGLAAALTWAGLALLGCGTEKPVLRSRASSPGNANGVALLARGLEAPARASFEQALEEALRSADDHAEIDARLNLALLNLDGSDHGRAAHHLVLAVERMVGWGDLGNEDRAVSWIIAAELVFAMGQREVEDLVADGARRLGSDAGLLLALAACARGDSIDPEIARATRRFEGAERDVLHIRVLRCEARAALRRREVDTALAYADRAIEVDKRGHDARALRDDLALGARALERGERHATALHRWLEVARVDAAMAHVAGLDEVSRAIEGLAPHVGENDRRRAATVLADLRERLALRNP